MNTREAAAFDARSSLCPGELHGRLPRRDRVRYATTTPRHERFEETPSRSAVDGALRHGARGLPRRRVPQLPQRPGLQAAPRSVRQRSLPAVPRQQPTAPPNTRACATAACPASTPARATTTASQSQVCENHRCVAGPSATAMRACPTAARCVSGRCVAEVAEAHRPQRQPRSLCTFEPPLLRLRRRGPRSDRAPRVAGSSGASASSASATRYVLIGRSDPRGTTEYNLALGERRARVVQRYMVSLGLGCPTASRCRPRARSSAAGTDEANLGPRPPRGLPPPRPERSPFDSRDTVTLTEDCDPSRSGPSSPPAFLRVLGHHQRARPRQEALDRRLGALENNDRQRREQLQQAVDQATASGAHPQRAARAGPRPDAQPGRHRHPLRRLRRAHPHAQRRPRRAAPRPSTTPRQPHAARLPDHGRRASASASRPRSTPRRSPRTTPQLLAMATARPSRAASTARALPHADAAQPRRARPARRRRAHAAQARCLIAKTAPPPACKSSTA
jgi:hypothetical protein